MKKIFGFSVLATFLVSCQGSEPVKTMEAAPLPVTQQAPAIQSAPASNGTSTPVANPAPAAAQVPTASPATTTAATGPVNPAHGAPGHRCDIAVGAPLNSAPATSPAPASAPTAIPVVQAAPAAAPATNGNVRLNPAHGMPGHDCAIPVGQPLKS